MNKKYIFQIFEDFDENTWAAEYLKCGNIRWIFQAYFR